MSDRNQRRTERRKTEGVRIIGAEEAQKALDAGQVAGRRSEEELRFGDVPPAPTGPRPEHRFPLPDSVDPAAAVRRPAVAPWRSDPAGARAARSSDPSARRPETGDAGAEGAGSPAWASNPGDADPADQGGPAGWTSTYSPSTEGPEQGDDSAWEAYGRAGEVVEPDLRLDADYDTGSWSQEPAGAEASADESLFSVGAAAGGADPGDPAHGAPEAGADYDPLEADDDPGAYAATGPLPIVEPGPAPAAGEAPVDALVDEPSDDLVEGADAGHEPWTWTPPPDLAPHIDSSSALDELARSAGRLPSAEDQPEAGAKDEEDATLATESEVASSGYDEDAYDPASFYDRPDDEDAASVAASPPPADDTYGRPAYDPPAYNPSSYRLEPPDSEGSEPGQDPVPDGGSDTGTGASEPDAAEEPAVAYGQQAPVESDPEVPVSDQEDRITVTGAHRLPHWTEAPAADESGEWATSTGAGWRHEHDRDEWDDRTGFLADDGEGDDFRVGALDDRRTAHSDIYSFDEAFQELEEERSGAHPIISVEDGEEGGQDAGAEQVGDGEAAEPEAEPAPVPTGARARAQARRGSPGDPSAPIRSPALSRVRDPLRPSGTEGQDVRSRIVVGVGLVALLIIAYAIGSVALVILAGAGAVLAAAEAYGILQRCGFRPATLLGLAATAGFMFAVYWKGVPAIPLVAALTFAATMLWYLLGIVDARPLANVAVSSMAVAWVGLLASFAALLLRAPNGRGLFLGVVVVVVADDIVSFFIGRQFGRRLLAPNISPGKTVEGLLAGIVAAIVVGLLVGKFITPWAGMRHGLELGVVVAVLAPIGDLFESLIKRDLSVKDSGSSLAGHGGLLDRIDSLLLVLPAAYYLVTYTNILR